MFHPEIIKIKVCHQVISREDISIPVRKEIILEGVANESKTFPIGLIELSANENFPKGVLVASALLDLSKEVIPVRVVNITDRQNQLRKVK